jgi:hypothetical protein
MELTSDDPAVLQVPPTAQIGAGSRVLGLQLRAVAAGRARLELRHGGRLTCVSVAVAPDARPPGVAGTPVSLAVRPLTLLGEVGLPAGPRRTLSPHLPGGPVAGPVRLRSHRPDVVAVPGEVRPEPAGPRVELELDAVAPGEALVELDSGDHRWALVVRVGGPGQATAGQPAAVAVRPAAFTAELHLPRQGERTLSLPLLAEAAAVDTRVALASSDPSVVQVPAQALIPAGSRLATLALGAGREGRSELRIEVPGQVLRLPVRVGGAPVGPRTGTASWGLSVRPTGTAGRVHMGDRRRLTLDLPLFPGPADRDRTVTLTSRRPEVADTAEGTVTVPAGRTSAEVTFVARRVAGTVVFDVDRAGEQDTLELLLGRVADGPVVAPAVGVEIK